MPNSTPPPHYTGPEPIILARRAPAPPAPGKPVEEIWGWLRRQFGNNALMLLVLAGVLFFVGFTGRSALGEVADERLQPVRDRVDKHEQELRHMREDFHSEEVDHREIYRVMPRVRDSAWLEKPWPGHDGGTLPP